MNKKTLLVNFKDPMTDEIFKGTLTLKRKTIADTMNIKALKSIMVNGQPFTTPADDSEIEEIATVFTLYSEPTDGAEEWFERDKITSNTLIDHLYQEHKIYESTFWRSDKRQEFQRFLERLRTPSKGIDKNGHDSQVKRVVGDRVSPTEGDYVGEVCVDGDTTTLLGTRSLQESGNDKSV